VKTHKAIVTNVPSFDWDEIMVSIHFQTPIFHNIIPKSMPELMDLNGLFAFTLIPAYFMATLLESLSQNNILAL
jgi:hypothetical protein